MTQKITRYSLAAILACLITWSVQAQVPTDNAYRTFYGNVPTHWTDSLHWGTIFNINDYVGVDMLAQANAAIAAAHAAGGGVVYFPAGVYNFSDNLTLKSGVILRGETPPILSAKDTAFDPPTRFEFPAYIQDTTLPGGTPNSTSFKTIVGEPSIRNAGIVYIAVNRAGISLRPTTSISVNTPKGPNNWYAEETRNLIVFGVRSNNVAYPDAGVPSANQKGWQRFVSRFSYNISVHATANSVVSNCRINDFNQNATRTVADDSFDQPGYLWQRNNTPQIVPDPAFARFDYANHYGISINRRGAQTFAEPADMPDLFRPGVECNDNWVYKTMRVGIMVAGLGFKCNRNVLRDKRGKFVAINPQGTAFQTNNSATYENRGIDWSGWNGELIGNDVLVYRHTIGRIGGYPSVDGESILTQECCGGTSVNGVRIKGNILRSGGSGYLSVYKMRDVYNVLIDSNDVSGFLIDVLANTNGANFSNYNVQVKDNVNAGNIIITGSAGGTNTSITGNVGTGRISAPCYVTVTNNDARYTIPSCGQTPTFNIPIVSIAQPAKDSLVTDPLVTSVDLSLLLQEGNPDSIYIYEGTTLVARYSWPANIVPFPIPAAPGRYVAHVLAKSTTTNTKGWSNQIAFTRPIPTSNRRLIVTPVQQSITLLPNPNNGQFVVDVQTGGSTSNGQNTTANYTITNAMGRVVLQGTIDTTQRNQINMSGAPSGVYIFQVRGRGFNANRRFVIN